MKNIAGSSHLRLIVMARRRLDGIVAEYACDGENMFRVLGRKRRGCAISEQMRVNPHAEQTFSEVASIAVDGLGGQGRPPYRDPEMVVDVPV